MAVNEMKIMDPSKGDVKVIWNPDVPAEVESARAQFNTLRGKGYLAYSVGARGRRGEQIREFNPDAESIILAPPLVGG